MFVVGRSFHAIMTAFMNFYEKYLALHQTRALPSACGFWFPSFGWMSVDVSGRTRLGIFPQILPLLLRSRQHILPLCV